MLTAQEIRRRYLDYFRRHQHEVVASGPLIPPEDPTLLFTNAGMVQFKELFLGNEKRAYKRAATCQKCLRVSGKHNDLENVGRTARHHTFFEMLGNFSFGDYFKREAISFAWEFVTKELELPPERLWVTIYREDDESALLWREIAGLPEDRIVRMGEKDNFWTMGDTGPCGPCSEIYIDQGEEMSCGPDCGIGKCDCDRYLEIWNLVFTQFDQAADGSRSLLSAPNIDTGMGLERIAAVCQGKKSNFDCDLFQEIIQYAARLAGVSYSYSEPDSNEIDTALRVIGDHSRAAAFLISEGVLPSNENRGYVLRRLIRRALRFATLMGVHEPFMHKVAVKVAEVMGEAYPELPAHAEFIGRVVFEEENRFAQTLDNGLRLLDDELERLKGAAETVIPGEFCFRLYDTYGFPLDIVDDVAQKRGFTVDSSGFLKLMQEQRERARASQKKDGLLGHGLENELSATCRELLADGLESVFIGYERLDCESRILALLDNAGAPVRELGEGAEGYVLAAETPFYGESGGQTGDRGVIVQPCGRAKVSGAIKPDPRLVLMRVLVETGELRKSEGPGDTAELRVNADARQSIARNHTCTHLLQASLRRILGEHVKQMGSLVDSERLRFDFTHLSPLSPEELAAVERDVNRAIMADFMVCARDMERQAAQDMGAMALFSEKYGETVRVLTIGSESGPESIELCGGTHLERTGQAGSFMIVSESGVAAGTRRIEAVTGWNAYNLAISQRGLLRETAGVLKTRPAELPEKVRALQAEAKKLRKSRDGASASPVTGADLAARSMQINGVNVVAEKLENVSVKALRELMDDLRSRLPQPAVACLAGAEKGKVSLLCHVSRDLHEKFTAPQLIKEISKPVGGSGGGRPDLAQAGGTRPEGLADGFKLLQELISRS